MVHDINSKGFVNLVSSDKKEHKLLSRLVKCKTRKCSKINKERSKAVKEFEKKVTSKCTQKNIKEWTNCLKGLDHSKTDILQRKYKECGEKKCSNEIKNLKKYEKYSGE
jgi:hypothetical protein